MIYLIDDKKVRQADFGWSETKLDKFSSYIKPLYDIEDVIAVGEDLYANNNVILYHESFLDFTQNKEKATNQRVKLYKKADQIPDLSVAFFSGSMNSRSLKGNVASLPVAKLYQNLESLIQKYSIGVINLKYLLYGNSPELEEKLKSSLINGNRDIDKNAIKVTGSTLFVRTDIGFIQNAIIGATEKVLFNDVSDEKLSQKVEEWLSEVEYDNIFIPLCFGQTLCDFNGLRLASHIRCTPSKNQLKRIFIYGFVSIDMLLDNEYFNVLKTKNVQLVDYNKKSFQVATELSHTSLNFDKLPSEISKLKLNSPSNYIDNHSISNEWAIYQWAKTITCEDTEELQSLFLNVQYNLYFKYLRTIHPISEVDRIPHEKLIIEDNNSSKVLLIDDECEKGWDEIFAHLGDINNIYVESIGGDFKSRSAEDVISESIKTINDNDIDVVFLDFRLILNDFSEDKVDEITSVKLLKEIKKINPGIQVIIFSATNKIWNLQILQKAGADGFVLKDSGLQCNNNILDFILQFETSLHKANWLKMLYGKFSNILNNSTGYDDLFIVNLKNNLSISFELLRNSFNEPKYLTYAYLQLYVIIESFLNLEYIFKYGAKSYVNRTILVHEKLDDNHNNSVLKFNHRSQKNLSYFSYEINESKSKISIGVDFKMSCVLIFLFDKEDSNSWEWSLIRDTRNTKAAHSNNKEINREDIYTIVTFLSKILNRSNFKISSRADLKTT